jgi:hypothetical protein
MVVDISDPKFDVKAMFLEFYSYRGGSSFIIESVGFIWMCNT